METKIYHDLARSGSRYWWNQGRQDLVTRLLQRFGIGFAANSPGRKILDIGCAAGGTLSYLARWGEAWGLDISWEAIALCKSWGVPQDHLVHGSAEDMSAFADETFDLVTAVEILEHLEQPQQALAEIRRILKPGGLLIITVPADQKLWSSRDERLGHHRRYTVRELAHSVAAAGFEILQASYANAFYYWPYRWLLGLRRWQQRTAIPGVATNTLDLPPWVSACLVGILKVENWLAVHWALPFGVSAVCTAHKKQDRSNAA